MSALLQLPFEDDEERKFEALTEALNEITRKCGAGAMALDRANARRAELMSGRDGLRRRGARKFLSSYIPPVTFFGIEDAEPATDTVKAMAGRPSV